MKILHSGLFHQTMANLGMVHGHREITAEGSEKLYQVYAQLELEFWRLPKYVSEAEAGPGNGRRRIVPAGMGQS